MKQFFKYLFASIIGFFISLFLISIIFFVFLFALVSSLESTRSVSISKNSVLELKFDYDIPERSSYQPINNYSLLPSMRKTIGINDLTKLIKHAKSDDKIEGIFLNLDNFYVSGMAKINSIRESLKDFKSTDKFIIAHGNRINEKAYYLGSVADSIYLTETGGLEFDGFGIEVAFFKNALEKLEIEPQIFQYGKFKSATEPFRLNKLSTENREQLEDYLNSVHQNFITEISQDINLDLSDLKEISSKLKLKSVHDAEKYGFVNELIYRDEVDSIMMNIIGISNLKLIESKNYLVTMNGYSPSTENRIAIIYSLGDIVNSEGDEYTIGTKNIVESIKKAKENRRVKAIVMRVNSPGGSPLTSDIIWREIEQAKKEKPFIVSMGDVAASGGYYISCNADKIVSEVNTLAGSIGVYGIIPNAQKFFNNKIGVSFDRVETSEYSSIFSITTPLSDKQKSIFQKQVDNIYYTFVSRVAEGRNMTFEEIDKIAEGRIWSGLDAKNIGLVDTIGGLSLALQIAAEHANISKYKIVEYPGQKQAFEKLMELFYSKINATFDIPIFKEQVNQINKLSEALKYTGIQIRLPFEYAIN